MRCVRYKWNGPAYVPKKMHRTDRIYANHSEGESPFKRFPSHCQRAISMPTATSPIKRRTSLSANVFLSIERLQLYYTSPSLPFPAFCVRTHSVLCTKKKNKMCAYRIQRVRVEWLQMTERHTANVLTFIQVSMVQQCEWNRMIVIVWEHMFSTRWHTKAVRILCTCSISFS